MKPFTPACLALRACEVWIRVGVTRYCVGETTYNGTLTLFFARLWLVIGGAVMLLRIINNFIRDVAGLFDENVATELEEGTEKETV